MNNLKEAQVQTMIERIINQSRQHEENFFTDSKSAAKQILQYLRDEQMIINYDEMVQMNQTLQMAS